MTGKKGALRRSAVGFSTSVLAVLVALGAGLLVGMVVAAPPPPTELATGRPATHVTVTERPFHDEVEVSVTVLRQDKRSLTTDAAGKITSVTCDPGKPLTSGTSALAVDGQPVVSLFTKVPMWRDLAVGDRGIDAAALNNELSRLGYSATEGDTVTRETIAGFRKLREDLGASQRTEGIAQSSILWLPAKSLAIASCAKRTGDSVAPGDAVMDLPAALTSAAITSRAEQRAAGDRVLVLGETAIPVPEDGLIVDADALATIAGSSPFTDAADANDSTSVQFSAKLRLAKPLTISVIPPSALIGLSDGVGCVVIDGEPQKVTVLGSELGQSFVVFDHDGVPGTQVDIAPDPTTKCG